MKKRELLVRVADLESKVKYLKHQLDRLQKRVADLELAQSVTPSVWKDNGTWFPDTLPISGGGDTVWQKGDEQWSYTAPVSAQISGPWHPDALRT